jgi:hypothetical protein
MIAKIAVPFNDYAEPKPKTFPSFQKREGVGGGTQKIGRFLVLETSDNLFPEAHQHERRAYDSP